MEKEGTNRWLRSSTGKKIWQLDPLRVLEEDIIVIQDVAHSCARQCRFAGHTRDHYSVAQHCVLASYLVKPEHAYATLMHDSQEAYIQDLTAGIKREMADYRRLEHIWEFVMRERFYYNKKSFKKL